MTPKPVASCPWCTSIPCTYHAPGANDPPTTVMLRLSVPLDLYQKIENVRGELGRARAIDVSPEEVALVALEAGLEEVKPRMLKP